MSKYNETKNNDEQVREVALDFTQLQRIAWNELREFLNSDSIRINKYSRDDIRRYLKNPESYTRQLQEVSLYLYISSGYYMRVINYFSSMLTLDHIVVPYGIDKQTLNASTFKKNYNKVVDYIESYNIKHELPLVIFLLLINGVYFGYERWAGNNFTIQKLPTNYCKITGIENGIFTFSMNMRYFDKPNVNVKNFADEIQKLYERYRSSGEEWQPISASNGVCFVFSPHLPWQIPPFSGIFEDVMDIEDYKEMDRTKQKMDNFKLIQQKIPFKDKPTSERDFLISLESVKMFHNNIKKVLPKNVGLVSSPMELIEINVEQKRDYLYEGASKAKEGLFDASGVSKGLFNSVHNNAVSINRGINVDEAFLFPLLRQFERFFKYRLSQFNTRQYKFKLLFPDLTRYNWKEKYEQYLKASQFGFPKSFVAASLGYSVSDLEGLNFLENDYLGLVDEMVPVVSTHTSSNKDRGRPQKDDNELSPSGEQTREIAANEDRE